MEFEFRFKKFSLNHSQSSMKIGTDAILLSASAPKTNARRILDIGTGCGVVAMIMAQYNCNADITAIDIDSQSIAQASSNFSYGPFCERMQAINIGLQEFANNKENHAKYDCIVSNPPYFVNSLSAKGKARNMARHNESLPFEELVSNIAILATPDAFITIILPYDQTLQTIQLFKNHGIYPSRQIEVYSKSDKAIERMIVTYRPFETKNIEIERLILRNQDNDYTTQYKTMVADILL